MTNNKDIEAAFRYLLQVGYNHGNSKYGTVDYYDDEFGAKFDLETLREPEKSVLKAQLDGGWQSIYRADQPVDNTEALEALERIKYHCDKSSKSTVNGYISIIRKALGRGDE